MVGNRAVEPVELVKFVKVQIAHAPDAIKGTPAGLLLAIEGSYPPPPSPTLLHGIPSYYMVVHESCNAIPSIAFDTTRNVSHINKSVAAMVKHPATCPKPSYEA